MDYIAAISGSSIVAASYACGSLPQLKQTALELNNELLFNLIERSKNSGGLYNLKKVEEALRVYTHNKKFEEVNPKLGIVATDINAGEEVVLQVGDIARAVCASCTLPGVFEPMPWGEKSLIDGGVFSIVPGNVAAASGADVVIGIDLRATRHVFSPWQIYGKRIINKIKNLIWPNQINLLWQKFLQRIDDMQFFDLYPEIDSGYDQRKNRPGLFKVLGRSLDLAIMAQERNRHETDFGCDMLIIPQAKKYPFWKKYLFLHFTDFSHTEEYYQLGRKTAEGNLAQMWQLIADKEKQLERAKQKVSELLIH